MSSPANVDELRAFVDRFEVRSSPVSAWSVGMHIEHCCLVISAICKALRESTPPAPRAEFSFVRTAMLKTGWIPRGRGKAPASTKPARQADASELFAMLDRAEADLSAASELRPDAWFRHFIFGVMNRDETLRFLAIHNEHHAKIIRDVVGRDAPGAET